MKPSFLYCHNYHRVVLMDEDFNMGYYCQDCQIHWVHTCTYRDYWVILPPAYDPSQHAIID